MTRHCPSCGYNGRESEATCVQCGFEDFHVWPPPPLGSEDRRPAPQSEARYRGVSDLYGPVNHAPGDFRAGLLAGGLTQFFIWCLTALSPFGLYFAQMLDNPIFFKIFVFSLPMVVVTFVYFRMRRRDFSFARGLGYSLLMMFGLFLGSLVVWH